MRIGDNFATEYFLSLSLNHTCQSICRIQMNLTKRLSRMVRGPSPQVTIVYWKLWMVIRHRECQRSFLTNKLKNCSIKVIKILLLWLSLPMIGSFFRGNSTWKRFAEFRGWLARYPFSEKGKALPKRTNIPVFVWDYKATQKYKFVVQGLSLSLSSELNEKNEIEGNSFCFYF